MRKARLGGAIVLAGVLLAVSMSASQTQQTASQQPAPQQPAAQQPPQTPPDQPPPQQPPPQQPPVFRTGISFVRVDAIVTDKQGNPVVDLKQTDFDVLEDGKPQTIETFRFVKADGAAPVEAQRPIRTRADEETAAANEDSRIFVFFLDDYHVRLGNSMAARKPLVDFVQNSIGANDLLAVMYPLTPIDAVTLTRDHQSVIRVLSTFEGRKFNYEPRNATEQRYALYPAETVERIRRQVALSAIEGLSVKLGALREGRKAVIVVSEGYTAMLPPQLRDPVATMPGFGNPNRRNPTAGDNSMLEDRAEFSGQLDVQQEMQDVFNAANRSNTALYTVDPRGLATGEFDIDQNVGFQKSNASLRQTQDTLRVLADETDGRAFVNRNDFGKAMKQIVSDSSAYYLLGYNSTQAPQDGKFHEIKVKVKRGGTEVRSRKGYWALTTADAARTAASATKLGPPPAVSKALSSITEPSSRARLIRTWVGTTKGDNGKTRVTFVWEPIAAMPGVRREMATSVALIAAAPDGATVYRGNVPDAAAPASNGSASNGSASNGSASNGSASNGSAANGGPSSTASPAPAPPSGYAVTFDAPPGRLQFRMSVNGANGPLDSDDREVIVPDLTSAEVIFGTPRVYIARTPREFQTINKDPNALPTASRDFRRTDRMVIRIDAYGPGNAVVATAAKLLNKQGARMADVPVNAPATAGQSNLIDFPLASLAAGEYLLELTATSEGLPPATELIPFRVGG
jgi:VWFA-related protein